MAKPKRATPLPDKQQLLRYIEEQGGRVNKREIARAFGLKGAVRDALKSMLRELADEGAVARGRRRSFEAANGLPSVSVIEVSEIDVEGGEVFARPTRWPAAASPPRIRILHGRGRTGAPAIGERILARLTLVGPDLYHAEPIRRLGSQASEIIGVYQIAGKQPRLIPSDRRIRNEFLLDGGVDAALKPGELVAAEVLPGRHRGLGRARLKQRIGHIDDPRSFSLISIHAQGIPIEFSAAALEEAASAAAAPFDSAGRVDLRGLPLVTIDPSDARDFDDAVWAEPDPDSSNQGGWHIVVAIADVAHYVRSGTALDDDARARGNSVYFPDRMVPMLPDALATAACTLSPHEDRPCIAAHLWLDAAGHMRSHRFERSVMRSAARLTYAQAQAAIDGTTDEVTAPLLETALRPLFAAYAACKSGRDRRQPLAIDLPERRVVLDDTGHVASISGQPRYDSHRLIEEFMIAANVAAARTLESSKLLCMYRVHDVPDPEKLEALRDLLGQIGLKLSRAQAVRPQHFNAILDRVAGTPDEKLVNEVVLRAQARAIYSPTNIGHYGLNLRCYAHFTSPIRRYADLLVHRALISALGLGAGGLGSEREGFAEIAEQITATERRADAAERDATDRYVAAFLADRAGAEFAGHITGVSRFGLFVGLEANGVDGLVPIRSLDDYYIHDEAHHALVGRHSGQIYRLGDPVRVRLEEVDIVTGSLSLVLLAHEGPPAPPSHVSARLSRKLKRSHKSRRR